MFKILNPNYTVDDLYKNVIKYNAYFFLIKIFYDFILFYIFCSY